MPRRHLRWHSRAACGHPQAEVTTSDPAEVNCLSCQRTIAMAITEIRGRLRNRRRFPYGNQKEQQ